MVGGTGEKEVKTDRVMTYKPFCDCGNPTEGRTGKCASCNRLDRKAASVEPSDNGKPINQFSKKRAKIEQRYIARLRVWKRGKKCAASFAHDCSGGITCHHMMGRGEQPHDEWAAENDIPLTLDERFWLPVCLTAHRYIEEHPKFAHEHGYRYLRLAETTKL